MPAKRSLLAALVAAIAVLAVASTGASAASPQGTFPYCSWWAETTPETLNVAFPDAAATYWTTPFYAEPGLEIRVEGTYPDARYMSFNVYDETGGSFEANGVSSGIADYEIGPDAGSSNPFQIGGEAGGAFTVTVSGSAKPGDANTLPLAPEGEAGTGTAPLGFLLYRVYLPTDDNETVRLPKLTFVKEGMPVTLPRCPSPSGNLAFAAKSRLAATKVAGAFAAKIGAPPNGRLLKAVTRVGKALKRGSEETQPCRASECPPPMKFFRASAKSTNSLFPNVDNAYVSALIRPLPGKVIVVRGKAPVVPPATVPVPWPQPPLQLRYFSLCNNVYRSPWPVVANPASAGTAEYGCASDIETKLNRRREYAYVVADPSLRGAIEKAGGTFIPLSTTQPHARQILIFRNMLPNESFTHAVQDASADGSPEGAAAAMGAYYPRAYRCTLAQFESGARACG